MIKSLFAEGSVRNALLSATLLACGWCVEQVIHIIPVAAAAEQKLSEHDRAINKLFELQASTAKILGELAVQNAHLEGKIDTVNQKIDERLPQFNRIENKIDVANQKLNRR